MVKITSFLGVKADERDWAEKEARMIVDTATSSFIIGDLLSVERFVAQALRSCRERTIEECAKVADGYWGCAPIVSEIRALAGEGGDKNG